MPSPLLAPYVSSLWVYDQMPVHAQGTWSILPDTATYICFICSEPIQAKHRDATYTADSGLSGFQSYRFDLEGSGTMTGVTVRLTPWGLSAFLGGAVKAVAEIRADCGDVFPRAAVRQVEDRLFHLRSAEARARCVEDFLLTRLRSLDHEVDMLVRAACQTLGRAGSIRSIGAIARDFGICERTLERRFLHGIGTTPKKYALVRRLRDAVLMRDKFSSWTDIAHAAGYFDQSHLIRDCQEIYGDSPEALFPLSVSDLSNSRLIIQR